jgi:pimeloyl-ACP methyl ester carboxylesterase
MLLPMLWGCAVFLPMPSPMRTVEHVAAQPAKCLFVLLPGLGDHAETFEQRGFVAALRGDGRSIDVIAVEATYRYYLHGKVVERLREEVIAPARARGYAEIWLAGPSMGGFGSLFYTRMHASDISGVLAIAPFLGKDRLVREIVAAGGLGEWRAPARVEKPGRADYERELWRWFQAITYGGEPAPPVYLGFGSADRLAVSDAVLAAALPPARVFRTEGGHEWPVWLRVLENFLGSAEFADRCRR